ncbi:hypothetical protein LCGC14_1727920 [marine sediment metagenome]|uniref:Serine protease n=1 Tax=marine sediment metagenome TaxID=412755 RepID=A0A0F9KA41_9ZZZZ
MKNSLMLVCVLLFSIAVMNLRSGNLPKVIKGVAPSVVTIEVVGEYGETWLGSGVIVHEHGLILTAKHVIEYADEITVILEDGREYRGVNKIVDPNNDVGIVQIALLEDLPIITLGGDVQIGEQVFIVGSPFELCNSVAVGIVSAEGRYIPMFGEDGMLQLDIAGNPGNSGSGVFNMSGEIVGMLVGGSTYGDGVCFAISVEACRELLEEYINE